MVKNLFTVVIAVFIVLVFCIGISKLLVRSSSISHLHNIKDRLEKGEAVQMQKVFPEGAFFSYVLYGSSWINVGRKTTDPLVREEGIREASWALSQVQSPEVANQFGQSTQLEHGIFYSGWLNRLRAGILLLQADKPDAAIANEFHKESERIAQAYLQTQTPILSSYPNQAWPADNIPALSSLHIHDKLYHTNYEETVIAPWKEKVRALYSLSDQLFPHEVDSSSGQSLKALRGASTGYLLSLLPEIDSQFSQSMYNTYEQTFIDDYYFFLLTREYPRETSSVKNTNSGPIFLGYGATASVMAISAANANEEKEFATKIFTFFDSIGLPFPKGNSSQYLFGKFLLYDIFLVWAETHHTWI